MQYILLSILSIPFLRINYKIVSSDIKIKKIPNKYLKYLIFLLPFYYIYIFTSPLPILIEGDINLLIFFGQIILTLIISFILYYFGIWSAGDAKYLLVLALFIPYIGIVTFIGNIALLTIGYLFLYFLWFYFGKCLFNWKYSKSLYLNTYIDLKEKLLIYLKSGDGNFYKKFIFLKLLKGLIAFLIIFVSLRLTRLFIFNELFTEGGKYKFLLPYINDYFLYLFITFIGIFIGIIIGIKWLYGKLSLLISKKLNIKIWLIYIIFLLILLIILLSFIYYEYNINPIEIKNMLHRIFTIMLGVLLIFLILRYAYKITFSIAESNYIDVKNLKEGDIVDKEYLIKIFGTQSSLGYFEKDEEKMIAKNKLLYPDPKIFFLNLENPIGNEDLKKLQKIYKIVNKYHKKNSGMLDNNSIKILNTFAFGSYIFIGFILSFLFSNYLIQYLVDLLFKIIKG